MKKLFLGILLLINFCTSHANSRDTARLGLDGQKYILIGVDQRTQFIRVLTEPGTFTWNGRVIATLDDIKNAEINTVNGVINVLGSSDIVVPIGDSGLQLTLRYVSADVSNLYVSAIDEDIDCLVVRKSIYGSTPQAGSFNGIATSSSLELLDDILTNGSDKVWVNIKTASGWWQAEVFSEPKFGASIFVELKMRF